MRYPALGCSGVSWHRYVGAYTATGRAEPTAAMMAGYQGRARGRSRTRLCRPMALRNPAFNGL